MGTESAKPMSFIEMRIFYSSTAILSPHDHSRMSISGLTIDRHFLFDRAAMADCQIGVNIGFDTKCWK
jgi:hypothetical protein